MTRWVFWIMLLSSTLAFANNQLVELLPNDPLKKTSWESRTLYQPYGKEIDATPIRQIRKNWCAANVLNLEKFPEEARQSLAYIFQESNWAFAIDNLKIGNSDHLKASIGVVRLCDENINKLFLLITKSIQGKPPKILFVKEFERETKIVVLKKLDGHSIRAGFCIGCDFYADLTWKNGNFEWLPDEEMGE
jgi:hypothetical protein